MSNPKLAVVGFIAVLAALWGGAYVLQCLDGTWMAFPAFMTSAFIGAGGMISAIVGSGPK